MRAPVARTTPLPSAVRVPTRSLCRTSLAAALLVGCAAKNPNHSACLKPHYGILTSDVEVLDRLGYCGEHRGVFVIGSDRCYTNDTRVPSCI